MEPTREFDLVVIGATGLTGRLVIEQLAQRDALSGFTGKRHWAVAGRSAERLAKTLAELQLEDVGTILADLDDQASLRDLAARTTVVLSCAGPYTSQAEGLIEACVQAGSSYVDLSGEIPLLRRVIDRFDEPARRAGVQVVQMAGWEAMPADLTTLVACQRAVGSLASELPKDVLQLGPATRGPEALGPGAANPIASVHVGVRFLRRPEGGVPFKESVSAGTMASIVEILKDPDAGLVGLPASLLPVPAANSKRQKPASLLLRPQVKEGRVFGPVVPVAFLNPPIVYRTAALLARERGVNASFAKYREGLDLGQSAGLRGIGRRVAAAVKGATQRLLIGVTRLPLPLRRRLAGFLERFLPPAGSGPSGRYLTQWTWEVEAKAIARNGRTASCMLSGTGHPGYTATAAMIAEVALHMADRNQDESRSGCLTPALTLNNLKDLRMKMPSLTLQ